MKLIPGKFDDTNNKIRPGSAFVGTRTDNLKYIDKDGAEAELVPVSRYYASTKILRGQPVSIAQLSKLSDSQAKDEFAYIKVTDPDVDDSCLGLALNYAEEGQIVHVQRYGKFSYLTTKSEKYTEQNAAGELKEVFVNASEGFLFDSVRGQKLFIKKNGTNNFDTLHNEKSEEHLIGEKGEVSHSAITIKDTASSITYDLIDSVYTAKNTIQIGQLTDAPTTVENDEDQVVTIELDITGDTRGPIDHTQFIVTLGEDIYFDNGKKDATLTEPYNDEGIFNEVKVVALASHGPEKAQFAITPRTVKVSEVGDKTSFISVRKLGGGSVIIPFVKTTFDDLCNVQVGASDIGYLKLLKSKYNSDQSDPVILDPIVIEEGNYTKAIKDKILEALIKLDANTFKEGDEYVTESVKEIDNDTMVNEYQITAAATGGYFDIYESENLVKFFILKTLNHGSQAKAGTAVLADIRDANRTNVIGVVASNQAGVHCAGETIKVMRAGRFLTNGKLKVGAEYFLGLNGRITTRNQYWYDTNVKIGTVENERNLIVNVQEMQHDFTGELPIAYMKECKAGTPERGFLLADGETYYDVNKYNELYTALQDFYTKEEMQCYIKNADGTLTSKVDPDHFIIPRITMNNGSCVAQVKYTTSGLYHNLPRAPFLRFAGEIFEDKDDKSCKVESRDITRLVHYGTLEQSRIAPTLENIEVRLFIREPNNELFPLKEGGYADKYIWREMTPGFHVYNNDTVYGFDWVVKQNDYDETDGVYVLEINTNQGLGICKISAQGQPIPLKGAEYKLIVTGKNLWTREYSLLDTSDVADTMEMSTDDLAPSVNAIKEYYEKKVATERLEAGKGEFYSDKDGTHIGNLDVDEIQVKDKTIVYYEDAAYLKHLKTLATDVEETTDENGQPITIKGVHGMYNKGVEGNLDAAKVGGLSVGDGKNSITQNFDAKSKSYIPYVNREGASQATEFNAGTTYNAMQKDGTVLYTEKGFYAENDNTTFENSKEVKPENIKKYVEKTSFADNTLTETVTANDETIKVNISGNGKKVELDGISVLGITDGLKVGSTVIPETFLQTSGGGQSSIAFKTVKNEKIDPAIKDALAKELEPNTSKDANGKEAKALNTSELATSLSTSFSSLGSALQALYEMPLSVFDYNYGNDKYKEQLGILVERINQIRDTLKTPNEDILKAFAHKKNTLVKTTTGTITNADEGADKIYAGAVVDSERAKNNTYIYTDTEAKSIAAYLDLVTNKQELAQEIRSTVTILMAAAQETQERLLNVETSVFGLDASTVPGEKVDFNADENIIDPKLKDKINSSPLLLGLNRLMRTLCLEIYNTTDLEKVLAEQTSVLADSDTLKEKVTVATRIDEVDRIMSDLMYRINGLTRLEEYSDKNIETHNYEKLVDGEKAVATSNVIKPTLSIADTKDTHNRTGKVDESGTWTTLPSSEDYTEEFAEFAKSSTNKKHSPNAGECAIVQTPVLETETRTVRVEVAKDTYEDREYEIEKPVYDEVTGLPVFNEQGVALLDAKVERINKKLSAVTNTIYGEDSVLAKFPNRTEVLRRNITNLIDDLYPNRDFEIEVLDSSSKLYKPFEESVAIGERNEKDEVTSGSKNAEGEIVSGAMNDGSGQKESIIVPLIKTLYNFTSEQNFLMNVASQTQKPLKERPNTPEVEKGTSLEKVYWDAKKLKPADFETATNQIDWIKSALGIKDTLSNDYLYSGLFQDLGLGDTADSTKASESFTHYESNLMFWSKGTTKNDTPVDEIKNATTVRAMISRKANPLEHRISMLEAAMDDFANWSAYVKKFTDDQTTSEMSGHNDANGRFEKEAFTDNLQGLVNAMAYRYNDMFLFPDDMAVRSYWKNDAITSEKNRAIINEIDKLYKVTSVVTSTTGADYEIHVKKSLNNTDLPNSAISSNGYNEAIINVKYVKPNAENACESSEANTIYLHADNTVNTEWAHHGKSVDNVGDMNVDSDFSHRMMMETMKAVAKDVAQSTFDFAFPIGAVKVEKVTSPTLDDSKKMVPTFGPNPYGIDSGEWTLIKDADFLSTADADHLDDVKVKTALPDTVELKGTLNNEAVFTYNRKLDPKEGDHVDTKLAYYGYDLTREIRVGDLQVTTPDVMNNTSEASHTVRIKADCTDAVKSFKGYKYSIGHYDVTYTYEKTPESTKTETQNLINISLADAPASPYKYGDYTWTVDKYEVSEDGGYYSIWLSRTEIIPATYGSTTTTVKSWDGKLTDAQLLEKVKAVNSKAISITKSSYTSAVETSFESTDGGDVSHVVATCGGIDNKASYIEFTATVGEKQDSKITAGDEHIYENLVPSKDNVILTHKTEGTKVTDELTAVESITNFDLHSNIVYKNCVRLLYWRRDK